MASCILYQNADQTITVLDIPRSIEQAQGFHNEGNKHLISSKAIEQPFASIEPKSATALRNVEAPSVRSLLLERFIELALAEVQTRFKEAWCFPRVIHGAMAIGSPADLQRHLCAPLGDGSTHKLNRKQSTKDSLVQPTGASFPQTVSRAIENMASSTFCHNGEATTEQIQVGSDSSIVYIPPQSSFLYGDVEDTSTIFNVRAPQFNLMIMDPPWPNHSARRKKSYKQSARTPDVAALLFSIPLAEHFAEDALVGIWVTNKPAIHDLVLGLNGLFDFWEIDFVEEWVWLKVTASGEPMSALQSTWRKPYEILLVGRKRSLGTINAGFKRRVVIGVPDLHSRKPNLKTLFEPMLPSKYEAMEVFARNLSAGWWAWGNEVLKFQSEEHWLDSANKT